MAARPLVAAIGTAIGLSACAVGPDFHHPAAPTTDRYTAQPVPVAADGAQTVVADRDPPQMWWQDFGSSALDDVVSEALRANPSVASAEAALRQAQENTAAARGGYWPQVQLSAEASRNRDAVQVLSPTLTSGASVFNLYTPQVSVSYVPDLFGANRRQVESLEATADYSRDEYDAAYLTLAANVVACSLQEAGLRAQIAATRQIIDSERESLQLMRHQLELGAIAEADAMAQEAALAQLEASLPPLQKNLDQQRDLLAVLTGRLPSDPPPVEFTLDALTLPASVPISVPSRLVERRPDVRAADAQLHVASANVGVAIGNMLPQITLSASLGSVATQTAQILSGQSEFWSVGATLSQTLFAGGTLWHRERAARAALDQAGAEYRAAVLTAFQNVADALRALAADTDATQATEHGASVSAASLEVARHQYDLGAVSYLALLSAQQTYQQALIAQAQARTNRYLDTAALFQALGGTAPRAARLP